MDRMYNQKGAGQTAAEYWGYFFGGFSDKPETSLYKSCEVKDPSTAVINITRSTSSFPTILSLDSFSMQSPTALKAGDANNVVAEGEGFKYPAYAMAPVGIGPYKLDKYDEANKTVTLVANDAYFGDKPKTAKIVFKIIPDESTRRQELQAGSIDGYDLPNPVDWKGLEDDGNQVAVRPAFNILYMGLNGEKNPKLKDLKVRQAIYHALNRDQMVKTQLPEGAKVATQFMPDTVSGYNTDLQPYGYDPEKAKALLKEAGAEGMTLQFAFPTEVSRPYMPDPQKIHARSTRTSRPSASRSTSSASPGTAATSTTPTPTSTTPGCWAGPATTTPRTTSWAPSSPTTTRTTSTPRPTRGARRSRRT